MKLENHIYIIFDAPIYNHNNSHSIYQLINYNKVLLFNSLIILLLPWIKEYEINIGVWGILHVVMCIYGSRVSTPKMKYEPSPIKKNWLIPFFEYVYVVEDQYPLSLFSLSDKNINAFNYVK